METNLKHIKAAFIDIDNTLVYGNDINDISQEHIDALKHLQDLKIYTILATGRSEEDALKLRKIIRKNSYGDFTIVSNGSKIIGKDLKVIEKNYLTKELYDSLIKFGIKNNYTIKVSNNPKIYTNNSSLKRIANTFYKKYQFDELEEIYNLDFKEEHLAKLGFLFLNKKKAREAYDNIHNHFSDQVEAIIVGKGRYLEITEKEISKAFAAKILAEQLNFNLSEAIAFGDSLNDLSLFKEVGTKVAVGNAIDEIKSIATYVTDSVKNNGVANFINKNF